VTAVATAILTVAALIALAFAAGSVPFGVLIARRLGVDIREHGSGNIGATNVTRVLGPVIGLVVLVLDALKGALPVGVALHAAAGPWTVAATGLAAVCGHCFSPFLRGRGGKGVATAAGVFLVLVPTLLGLGVLVFLVVLRVTRVPALGSLAAMLAISAILVARGDLPFAALACAVLALMFYTHRSNLAKLNRPRGA
jgi:glycerol-3-phosphate acyltransferase PlsY